MMRHQCPDVLFRSSLRIRAASPVFIWGCRVEIANCRTFSNRDGDAWAIGTGPFRKQVLVGDIVLLHVLAFPGD